MAFTAIHTKIIENTAILGLDLIRRSFWEKPIRQWYKYQRWSLFRWSYIKS